MLRVNKVITTFQDKGLYNGTIATFVRLQGCNVGCSYCDIKETWGTKKGVSLLESQIVRDCNTFHENKLVVITGGEPLMQNLDSLLTKLHRSGHFTQVETSGAFDFQGFERPNWIIWSPTKTNDFDCKTEILELVNEVIITIDYDTTWEEVDNIYKKFFQFVHSFNYIPPFIFLVPEGMPATYEVFDKTYDLLKLAAEKYPKLQDKWRLNIRTKTYHNFI